MLKAPHLSQLSQLVAVAIDVDPIKYWETHFKRLITAMSTYVFKITKPRTGRSSGPIGSRRLGHLTVFFKGRTGGSFSYLGFGSKVTILLKSRTVIENPNIIDGSALIGRLLLLLLVRHR